MSRSVSAPSSVTNTSPCWNGLIVPGSTLMYGSNFCTRTLRPRAFRRRPSEAAGEEVVLPPPHLPARVDGEASPVRLDADDARPPVGEMVRLRQKRPDVGSRRKNLSRGTSSHSRD